jgi:4-amino-4-deoxy-L-arabinose transferase-like glycosyltransferase
VRGAGHTTLMGSPQVPALPHRPLFPPGALLAAGALLALIGLHLMRAGGPLIPAIAVLLLGCAQALSGLFASRAGPVARQTSRLSQRCAGWLGVQPTQLLLIANGLILTLASRSAAGDAALNASPLATPLWLAGIVMVCAGCWARTPTPTVECWPRGEVAVVALLTLLALVVRAWEIGSMPYVLSGDEGSAGLTAWEFLSGARDNLLSLGWFSFPALYFGLLSASQAVFGRTAEAIRLVSALAGALTVPALYWMARQMFGRPAALAAAAWLAAFHVHVFFSRLAYNNIFDGLLFVLAAGGLWQGWQVGRRGAFVLAGLGLGLSQYFYTTARLTPIVLALWVLLLVLHRRPDRARLAGLAATGLVALAVFLPLGLLYAAHPDQLVFTASRVSMLIPGWTSEAAAALGTTSGGLVLEQIWVTALGLTVAELQGVYYAPGVPMLISVSAVLFIAGLMICLLRIRDPRYSLPLLVLAGTILLGGLSIQAPNSQRLLYMAPALALMVVLPLEAARAWSARHWPGGRHALSVLAALLVFVMLTQNLDQLFGRYFPREEYGSVHGEVTQAMIEIWPSLPQGTPVYFFGGERMGFASIPSLAYLRPDAHAPDLDRVDQIPPEAHDLIAFVLPDQGANLADLRSRFPEGIPLRRYNRHGRLLFDIWAVGDAAQALSSTLP